MVVWNGTTELIPDELKNASEILSREKRETDVVDGVVETFPSTAQQNTMEDSTMIRGRELQGAERQ